MRRWDKKKREEKSEQGEKFERKRFEPEPVKSSPHGKP
jgi:hypothetical protein